MTHTSVNRTSIHIIILHSKSTQPIVPATDLPIGAPTTSRTIDDHTIGLTSGDTIAMWDIRIHTGAISGSGKTFAALAELSA